MIKTRMSCPKCNRLSVEYNEDFNGIQCYMADCGWFVNGLGCDILIAKFREIIQMEADIAQKKFQLDGLLELIFKGNKMNDDSRLDCSDYPCSNCERLRAENKKLRKLAALRDYLCVCYKTGKRPSDKLLNGLSKLRAFEEKLR